MIPSRGVVQSVSSAGFRAKATGQLVSTRGYATGLARHTRASIRLPTSAAGRSPLAYGSRSSAIAAGAVFVGQIPSSSRNLSLWGWGSGSKDPAPTPPAATPSAAAPAQPAPEPVVASAPVAEPAAAAAAPAPVSATPVPDPTADLAAIINSDTAAVDIANITPSIGYLKELGIEFGYGSTSTIQWVLEHVHVYGGMPWWGTILATSILFRLVLWKPFLMGQEASTKMQILKREVPEYDQANEEMKRAAIAQDQAGVQAARHVVAAIEKEHGIKKWKAFISFVQIPIGIGMYRILKTAAEIPVPGLEDGGVLWFTNLAVADPWYILPAVGPIAMVATMRVTSRYSTPAQRTALKAMMVVGVPIMFFVTASFPAALQFYFMTASLPALFQTWLVYRPWFRRAIGLPPIPEPEVVVKKPGVGGAISSMKESYSQVTEMAAKKQRESRQKKTKEQQLEDEIKLTEQYYESLKERMAEMEKNQRMNRRP